MHGNRQLVLELRRVFANLKSLIAPRRSGGGSNFGRVGLHARTAPRHQACQADSHGAHHACSEDRAAAQPL